MHDCCVESMISRFNQSIRRRGGRSEGQVRRRTVEQDRRAVDELLRCNAVGVQVDNVRDQDIERYCLGFSVAFFQVLMQVGEVGIWLVRVADHHSNPISRNRRLVKLPQRRFDDVTPRVRRALVRGNFTVIVNDAGFQLEGEETLAVPLLHAGHRDDRFENRAAANCLPKKVPLHQHRIAPVLALHGVQRIENLLAARAFLGRWFLLVNTVGRGTARESRDHHGAEPAYRPLNVKELNARHL